MKHAGAFSFALVLGSMTLLAQNSGRGSKQPAVARVAPASVNCPVDMQAQWQFGRKWVQKLPANDNQPSGPGRGIKLTLSNSTFSEIVEVQITAYGLNSKPQLSPARATAADSSAIDKSFDVKIKVDPKSEASADLSLPGLPPSPSSTWIPSTMRVVQPGTPRRFTHAM